MLIHTYSAQQIIRDGYKIRNQIHVNSKLLCTSTFQMTTIFEHHLIMYLKNNLEATLYWQGIASVSQIRAWQSELSIDVLMEKFRF